MGLYFFIYHTFSLMKKYAKNQGRTKLLPTGLYAGPPFCRGLAFFYYLTVSGLDGADLEALSFILPPMLIGPRMF